MKFGLLFAFLMLVGALFAATAPDTSPTPPADPALAPDTSTGSAPQPPMPPISPDSKSDILGKSTSDKSANSASDTLGNSASDTSGKSNPSSTLITPPTSTITNPTTGYVGEGLYKSKNTKDKNTKDSASVLVNKNAANADASNELTAEADALAPARAPPRRQPAEVFSCTVDPNNEFVVQMGGSQGMTVTCLSDGAQTDCPAMGWESDLGDLNATSNSTATFIPTHTGSGFIFVSGDNYVPCNASVIVAMGNVTSLAVSPPFVRMPVGTAQQFSVNGYDDYNNSMVPNEIQAGWSVEGNAGVLGPDAGRFSALEEGNATITASWQGLSASAFVIAYIPRSCNITPANVQARAGENVNLSITCIEDNAEVPCPQASWSSALGTFAIPLDSNASAIFTAQHTGSGSINATSENGLFACGVPAEILMGNITSISISPQNILFTINGSMNETINNSVQQFYVNAYDDFNNSLQTTDANWSIDGNAGTINASGFFTAAAEGNATVSALYANISANASVSVRIIQLPPPQLPANNTPPRSSGTSSSGGTVGSAAGVSAKRSCAGNPVEATVSEWGNTIWGATVSLYLKEGTKTILVSQATSNGNGAATLKTEKEGDYELVASKAGMRDGRVSFYLAPCEGAGSGSLAPVQGSLEFAQAAGSSIVLEKETVNANFARTFSVRKVVDKDGATSYYTDVTTSYTNSAPTAILNFEVAETVPSAIFADVRSLAFTSYPRFSSNTPNTFYWKVSALSTGQKTSFTYRIPRALSAEMIGAFAAPSLLLGDEKALSATVESTKGNDVFTAVAAFAGTKDVSQLLELAGMTILALAVLFAAYTFFAGRKSQ